MTHGTTVFGFFAAFIVAGAVLFYLRRKDDRRFNAASRAIAEAQAAFWRRRMEADAFQRAGRDDDAAHHRARCGRALAPLRAQVAALRTGYPRQSEEAALFASYYDAGLREMAESLSAARVSDFDAAQLHEKLRRGPDAFRPPVEVAKLQVGEPGLVLHLVFGMLAGAVLGAGAAFYRRRWDAGLLETLPWFALAGAVLGGLLAALARDTFWRALGDWWTAP